MNDGSLASRTGRCHALFFALLLAGCGSKASTTSSASAKADAPPPSAAAPAGPRKVTLGKKPPAIGVRRHIVHVNEDKTKLAMRGSAGGIDVAESKTSTVDKVEECLEVKEHSCAKVKVSYTTDDSHTVTTTQLVDVERKPMPGQKPDEKKKDHAGANQGNTYVVTLSDKDPVVSREDKKPIKKAEIDEVKNAYDSRDDDAELGAALPDEVSVGDTLDQVADLLAKKASKSLKKPTTTSSVVVKELRDGGIVVLAIDVTIEGDDTRAGHMKVHLEGTLEFAADTGETTKESYVTTLTSKLPRDGGDLTGTMTETKTVTPAS